METKLKLYKFKILSKELILIGFQLDDYNINGVIVKSVGSVTSYEELYSHRKDWAVSAFNEFNPGEDELNELFSNIEPLIRLNYNGN